MSDEKLAKDILASVGGEGNVSSLRIVPLG